MKQSEEKTTSIA